MPLMLQRQLSRTLCDEYTNIFDDPLPSQSVPVLTMSEVSSSSSSSQCYPEVASVLLPPSPVSLKAMEISSWSPRSSVTTPGYSPSSETDDSVVLDSMSSPTSPLFPVLQTSPVIDVASVTPSSVMGSVSCSPEMLFAEDDDFFHNSFYRSLDRGRLQTYVSIHSTQKQYPLSLASAIISEEGQKSAESKQALSLTTAAPSEIFSVTMDELLLDPFQLSRTTTSATSQDTEMAYPAMETETMTSDLATETEKMASFVATLTQLSESNSNADDLDLAFSETSTLSEVSDDSDGEYVEASPVKNNNKRKPTSKAAKRPREAKYKRSKSLVQKTPKVYPPRPPRNKMMALDANMDMMETSLACTGSSGSSSSSKSRPGQKNRTILPHPDGGFMCDQCPGERFGRVHDLKRHQDSKHFVMTWPCDFCHRPFVRRDALLRHYVVKSARHDGIHPTDEESHRLYEAKARAKARC